MKIFKELMTLLFLIAFMNPAYAELPPQAQLDMKMLGLAEQLKNENFYNALYTTFPQIEAISKEHNLPLEDSFYYYKGEAAYRVSEKQYSSQYEYDRAKEYLEYYVSKAGSKGKFYIPALNMLQDISSNLHKLSRSYYSKALEYYGFAFKYNLGQDEAKGYEYLKKAAEHNHTKAMLDLGSLHQYAASQISIGSTGDIGLAGPVKFEKDIQKAIYWYEQALEKSRGNNNKIAADAAYILGRIYYYGQGVAANKQKAAEYFDLSASFSPDYKNKALEMAKMARQNI